jgi:hypothetical protein
MKGWRDAERKRIQGDWAFDGGGTDRIVDRGA